VARLRIPSASRILPRQKVSRIPYCSRLLPGQAVPPDPGSRVHIPCLLSSRLAAAVDFSLFCSLRQARAIFKCRFRLDSPPISWGSPSGPSGWLVGGGSGSGDVCGCGWGKLPFHSTSLANPGHLASRRVCFASKQSSPPSQPPPTIHRPPP
jgi:hypothetical protein